MEEGKTFDAARSYRRIGLALLLTAVVMLAAQYLFLEIATVLEENGSALMETSWFPWVVNFVPIYLVAIPAGILVMKKLPVQTAQKTKMKFGTFLVFLLMSFPLMYSGSLLGLLLSSVLSGGTATNALTDYIELEGPLKVLVIVVLAPLFEEYFFRKQIIDRTVRFGEKPAILFSALAFGLFHMNLYQIFYAFALGLVFAFIYIRTRKLRYTVLLHMIINFLGSVVAPKILEFLDQDKLNELAASPEDAALIMEILPGLLLVLLYLLLLLGCSIAGLILLIVKAPKLVFLPAEEEMPKEGRFRTVYGNIGWSLFFLYCLAMIVLTVIGS